MAQVPYDTGVSGEPFPTVAPRESVPDDYQHIQAKPEEFGSLIGQGEERLGAGASEAGKFFGQVQAGDASTQAMSRADDLVNKFRTLRGAEALNAQDETRAQIDQVFKDGREGLSTPQQQFDYDQTTRNFQLRYVNGIMASHADEQAKFFASNSNKETADFHLGLIAQNPNNEQIFRDNTAEAARARVRQTQIEGLGPDAATQAANDVIAEAHATRARAMAASGNAQAALDYANKNRESLSVVNARTGSTYYDSLTTSLKAAADQQTGTAVGREQYARATLAHPYASAAMPIYGTASSAIPGGYSQNGLLRTIQIESGGDPDARNGTHVGLGQFGAATWREVGQGSPTDPDQAVMATQRYAEVNRPILGKAIGRDPSDAELYLAHQQGPIGAIRLLTRPNVRAGDLVGDDAIANNGGDPNQPAYIFTSMWVKRFNTPGTAEAPAQAALTQDASPRSRHADAMSGVVDQMGTLSPGAYQHAVSTVNQLHAQDQITQDADSRAKKQANDDAMVEYQKTFSQRGYVTPDMITKMDQDPRLTEPGARVALRKFAEEDFGYENIGKFGPGFSEVMHRMFLPGDDPARIGSVADIVKLGVPGPEGQAILTPGGVGRLSTMLLESRKDPDQAAVNQTKASLINYAKSKLSFDQEMLVPGLKPMSDPDGAQIFNAKFVPAFESAYDNWVKAGKNPWDFLTQENVDKIANPLRSKTDMAMARIAAKGEVTGDRQQDQPIPPPLKGIEPAVWSKLMATRPIMQNGQPLPPQNWAQAIDILRNEPTELRVRQFNSHFENFDGAEIIKALGISNAPATTPAAPATSGTSMPPAPVTVSNAPPQPQPSRLVNAEDSFRLARDEALGHLGAPRNVRAEALREAHPITFTSPFTEGYEGPLFEESQLSAATAAWVRNHPPPRNVRTDLLRQGDQPAVQTVDPTLGLGSAFYRLAPEQQKKLRDAYDNLIRAREGTAGLRASNE